MKLYAFGYDPSSPTAPDASPTCILGATSIKILWSSWCDAVIASASAGTSAWAVEYRGGALTAAQAIHVSSAAEIKEFVCQEGVGVEFFGSLMHEGVRGYVTPTSITLFSSDVEIEAGEEAIRSYTLPEDCGIASIRVDGRGGCLVSQGSGAGVVYLDTIVSFREYLSKSCTSTSVEGLALFQPEEWCTNATTTTALDAKGQVYTATRDPRYPNCLGRAYTNNTTLEPVEYLSETRIGKVASGGYMTAAVSTDGELFLWGQANPGDEKMVSVLGEKGASGTSATTISADEEQDEMVKCLNVVVAGQEACVYDVAVGHGHVLVAAQVQKDGCVTARAVLGAGCNDRGQLGLPTSKPFVKEFEAIPAFTDLRIERLVAAGWSTLVVTSEE